MTRPVPIMFAGGGTGGHLFPGLAVAEQLKRSGWDVAITFCGTGRPWENHQVVGRGHEYICLRSAPLSGSPSGLLRTLLHDVRGYIAARRLLQASAPAALVGLGGYGSVPMGLAAAQAGIPLVLLEQNVLPGRANCLMAPWASAVCVSFQKTRYYLRTHQLVIHTGNPLRREILEQVPAQRRVGPSGSEVRPMLLVMGGTQGARSLNRCIIEAIPRLAPALSQWYIVHQTGAADAEQVRAAFAAEKLHAEVHPYIEDIATAYGQASLAICRAGATTLAELAFAGIPAVLLPFPQAARQHQLRNAQVFAQAGAARVVADGSEPSRTARALTRALLPLIETAELRTEMGGKIRKFARPTAAAETAKVILGLATAGRPPGRRAEKLGIFATCREADMS